MLAGPSGFERRCRGIRQIHDAHRQTGRLAMGKRFETPRRTAVGVALEPESSRWRLQEVLRLSVERTCTPTPTCNPRGCAYRLRDMTDWQALQGAVASIPNHVRRISLVLYPNPWQGPDPHGPANHAPVRDRRRWPAPGLEAVPVYAGDHG